MRSWRKMTWAILIWTGLFVAWGVSAGGAVSNNCAGEVGDALAACQAGTAIGGGLAFTFIFFLWFVGFIVLALIWFMSRPRASVMVYGPQGQQVAVTESEAKRRVKQGWTYAPGGSVAPGQSIAPVPPTGPTGDGWR